MFLEGFRVPLSVRLGPMEVPLGFFEGSIWVLCGFEGGIPCKGWRRGLFKGAFQASSEGFM